MRSHKHEAKALQEPFVQNHQVAWNVRNVTVDKIAAIVDRLSIQMQKNRVSFKGHWLQAMMEVSPERRRAAKACFAARGALNTSSDDGWEGCGRALKTYSLSSYRETGAYH